MKIRNAVAAFIISMVLCLHAAGEENGENKVFSFSGYFKNISALMDFPMDDSYHDILNRLRLRFDIAPNEHFKTVIEYDVELQWGDFVGSTPYKIGEHMKPEQFMDIKGTLIDDGDVYATHSLSKAFIQLSSANVDFKAGRYVLDWGSGRAWNPNDPFYPLNPLYLERDERIAADAVGIDFFINDLSSLSAVVAGEGKRKENVRALRYRTNLKETDIALSGFYDDGFSAGIDISRTLWNTEFHTSCRYGRDGDIELTAGADRAFTGKFHAGLEYYRNGEGTDDRDKYDWLSWLNGDIPFMARDYVFAWGDWEIFPLLRLQAHTLANINDGGIYVNPVLLFSPTANTELSLGMVDFNCDNDDEFALYPELLYLQFQLFF